MLAANIAGKMICFCRVFVYTNNHTVMRLRCSEHSFLKKSVFMKHRLIEFRKQLFLETSQIASLGQKTCISYQSTAPRDVAVGRPLDTEAGGFKGHWKHFCI